MEHLTLLGWNPFDDLITNYNLVGVPFVILVDKTGVIDYLGNSTDVNLE